MRTLITGSAGFLGSHLCDRLLSEGHEVIGLDNLLTGSADNLAHLLGHPRFRFVQMDVTEFVYAEGALRYVLHLASPASPVAYLRYPIQTLKVGALGTHKALGLAKAKGATFLLTSTSEVYGDPRVHPQPEDYWGHVNPVGPRGVYDEAKRFGEALTMAYQRAHCLQTRIARIFNVYGPRMRLDDGRAVSNFIVQALRGEPLTIHGDGSQTRSFCYVDDMVEGLVRLLHSRFSEPVNLGNPHELPVRELAERILVLTKSKSQLVFLPRPVDDPQLRRPDIARARNLLGWEPKVSLDEGLKATIEDFRHRLAVS